METFQSTLPVWGGTLDGLAEVLSGDDFNPPSPCGEGRRKHRRPACRIEFQSTLPVWGGTGYRGAGSIPLRISIHPPRVGRDGSGLQRNLPTNNFNPPSPCGEGLAVILLPSTTRLFQSTLPVWGGTRGLSCHQNCHHISIHPPRVGRDDDQIRAELGTHISIHPPRVGRDRQDGADRQGRGISIHPPRVGRDHFLKLIFAGSAISIHPPRVGRDNLVQSILVNGVISIHPPRVGRDA